MLQPGSGPAKPWPAPCGTSPPSWAERTWNWLARCPRDGGEPSARTAAEVSSRPGAGDLRESYGPLRPAIAGPGSRRLRSMEMQSEQNIGESIHRRHVLIVEDDPTVSEVVARYLGREGFEVEVVADGRAAVERARTRPPDAMVLDLMLPGLDGLEVFRRLRSFSSTPVIMLTARGNEDDRVLGLELGADDYVSKPFSPRELTARIKSVLRRAENPPATPETSNVVSAADLSVDLGARE